MTQMDVTDWRAWTDPAKAAQVMVSQALSACADETQSSSLDSLLEQLQNGDPATWNQCRLALAQRVGEYLEAYDDDVKAVYIYDNEWTQGDRRWEEASVAPLIHLIVWAQPKTAALRALISILNRALAHKFGGLVKGRDLAQLLDVQVIDDQDVSSRAGYATLLASPGYRPVQVWGRRTPA